MPATSAPLLRAETSEGIALPVLDITNPAFKLELDEAALPAEIERFVAEEQRRQRVPGWLMRLVLAIFARRSHLVRTMRRARAGYLPGLATYYLKLGADNLPPPLDDTIDRQIVSSLAARSVRLRLEQLARLLAEALTPELAGRPEAPLRLFNIAGGPAMDSLNALILIAAERRDLLAGRPIVIDVLDIDPAGPAFGRKALRALQGEGQALAGLDIGLEDARWDWRDLDALAALLWRRRAGEAVSAISSEGGLFEYGTDAEITGVLRTLRGALPAGTVFAGSVTRGDAATRLFRKGSPFPIVPRGLEAFSALAEAAGWRVAASRQAAFSDQVLLRPRP